MAGNKNSGRKAKQNAARTSIHVSNDVLTIFKAAGNGNISLGAELLAYESEYGHVTHEGKYFTLTAQADFTNRQLPNGNGEYFEMSAPALDHNGNHYTAYWIFERKYTAYEDPETGEPMEAELDAYDYENVDRVVED